MDNIFHPYDVFISYKSNERDVAERVEAMLVDKGLLVWRDDRLKDAAGKAYDVTINDALDQSAKVLVLWSAKAIASDWVRGEATKAKDQEKLVPLLIEPCEDLLPAPFNLDQFVTLQAVMQDRDVLFQALTAVQTPSRPVAALSPPLEDLDHLPDTHTGRLFGRDAELELLARAWDGHDVQVAVFDAIGGTGKTALAHHFVHGQLVPAGWRGCRVAMAFSFYSQGSTEDKQVEADTFFRRAFALFGKTAEGQKRTKAYRADLKEALKLRKTLQKQGQDPEAVPLPDVWPPVEAGKKGAALAELVQAEQSLLILDGLEPLQYVTDKGRSRNTESDTAGHFGGIKDQDVKILLQRLARHNPGLCLVLTRVPVTELDDSFPFVEKERLRPLSAEAGTELLRALGVEPQVETLTDGLRAEFATAVDELGGHALALNLAGRWVAEHRQGQLKAIHDIPQLEQHENVPEAYRNPFRVFRTMELGLLKTMNDEAARGREPLQSRAARQLTLLYFLGLFDRPADVRLLRVVFPSFNGKPQATVFSSEPQAPVLNGEAEAPLESSQTAAATDARGLPLNDGSQAGSVRHEFDTLPVGELFAAFSTASRDDVRFALKQLARQGLVARRWQDDHAAAGEPSVIDCHPLVREYFGSRLEQLAAETFREAHGRLYDHFRFEGLPEEFRDPVAYGGLALKSAYGENADVALGLLLEGQLSASDRQNLPPSIAAASDESVRSVRSLLQQRGATALAAFRPEDGAGMEPLFAAIAHGCLAGRHDECFSEVYWPRIARGNEGFAVKKLGLYGQELAAVASFFARPFGRPSQHLTPADQALVLNLAGFRLRAIGRLLDAIEPMHAAVESFVEQENWKESASNAGNLSELLVTLGRLDAERRPDPAHRHSGRVAGVERSEPPAREPGGSAALRPGSAALRPQPPSSVATAHTETPATNAETIGALETAAQAVQFADKSGDSTQEQRQRTKHAAALLARGRLLEAEERFREAERLQQQHQPSLPRLYSLQGFLYGDLLLARRRPQETADRAEYRLEIVLNGSRNLLDIGLAELQCAQAQARFPSASPSTFTLPSSPFNAAKSTCFAPAWR